MDLDTYHDLPCGESENDLISLDQPLSPKSISPFLLSQVSRLRSLVLDAVRAELRCLCLDGVPGISGDIAVAESFNIEQDPTENEFDDCYDDQSNEDRDSQLDYESDSDPSQDQSNLGSADESDDENESVLIPQSETEPSSTKSGDLKNAETHAKRIRVFWHRKISMKSHIRPATNKLCCLLSDMQILALGYNLGNCSSQQIAIQDVPVPSVDLMTNWLSNKLPSGEFKSITWRPRGGGFSRFWTASKGNTVYPSGKTYRFPEKMSNFIEALSSNDHQQTFQLSSLSSKYGNAGEGAVETTDIIFKHPPEVSICLPAFDERVSLFTEEQDKDSVSNCRNLLTNIEVSPNDIHTVSPVVNFDINHLWEGSHNISDDNLKARHDIDELSIQYRQLQCDISRLSDVMKRPLEHSTEAVSYLESSPEDAHYMEFFSQAKHSCDAEEGKDELAKKKDIRESLLADWCSGKSLEELSFDLPVETQNLWKASLESREAQKVKWEIGIRDRYVKILKPALEHYNLVKHSLEQAILRQGLSETGMLEKRVYLCDSHDIPTSLAQLSCMKADVIIVQNADEIDESGFFAAIPESTPDSRLILIKKDQSKKTCVQNGAQSLIPFPGVQSIWRRLKGVGLSSIRWSLSKQTVVSNSTQCQRTSISKPILDGCEQWKSLQEMIGLQEIKDHVVHLQDSVIWKAQSEQKGENQTWFLNRVFMGPPGIGKRTAARLYANVLKDLGLLTDHEDTHLFI
ncbi:hypothetical protein N7513_001744 [Penicillium frequentans]|nr:hypothetical protein N7513_001744 [Penicillium glabrum]